MTCNDFYAFGMSYSTLNIFDELKLNKYHKLFGKQLPSFPPEINVFSAHIPLQGWEAMDH